ncbi:Uncharacterised protein [Vibrio cholerae]|uniref:Uncharacterized protein n=1 Tax=Vibrio cholerae TaxID=666 RepID=A0A656ANY8_VIBCL|nr:Uncharacterised protein [Vibrio cholerae]CSB75800.1 Uncharacterised protein [Vibrio cholerae]CSD23841.1 Uncharacterised protein [Vibrio cholerae]
MSKDWFLSCAQLSKNRCASHDFPAPWRPQTFTKLEPKRVSSCSRSSNSVCDSKSSSCAKLIGPS